MNPTDPILQLDNVRFGYEPGQLVIDAFSAQLAPGRLCVLLGPNASGKSTLLRLMLGLLRPDDGRVRLAGRDIDAIEPARRASWVSYVPQHSVVSFAFTARQVVDMGRFALGPDDSAVDAALAACDLADLHGRAYNQLSTGQQQRVLLARAIAQSAGAGRLMLMDEPGSGMDLWHVHRMMQMLHDVARSGLAVLAVLHDLNLTARYADEVWLLHQGRLVAAGPWNNVLQPHVLEPVYQVKLATLVHPRIDRPVFSVDHPD